MMVGQNSLKRDLDDSDSSDKEQNERCGKRAKFERSFVPAWLDKYKWLRYDSAANIMFCELCLRHRKSNAFTEGCQNFRRDNLNKHINTIDHRASLEQEALDLSIASNTSISILGDANGDAAVCMKDDLPITPNYISNPPFPYMTQSQFKSISDSPVNLSMVGTNQRQTPSPQHASHQTLQNHTPLPLLVEGKEDENELVLKVRVANSAETDFIEIELDKDNLMFEALISIMCQELEVNRKLVQKIRKLPDTIVRKDKDVRRLHDFQELELVLTNKAISESSRNYTNSQPGPQPRPVDVVY